MKTIQLRPLDEAGQERVLSCMGLAHFLAKRCSLASAVPLEQAQDAAVDGLLRAAVRYDPQRGANFCTFAWLCIKQRLHRLAARRDRPRMIPFSLMAGQDERGYDPPAPAEHDNEIDLQEWVRRVEAVLPPRLFLVLRMRYLESMTLLEMSRRLGVSKERCRQLVAQAARHARKALPAVKLVG